MSGHVLNKVRPRINQINMPVCLSGLPIRRGAVLHQLQSELTINIQQAFDVSLTGAEVHIAAMGGGGGGNRGQRLGRSRQNQDRQV